MVGVERKTLCGVTRVIQILLGMGLLFNDEKLQITYLYTKTIVGSRPTHSHKIVTIAFFV